MSVVLFVLFSLLFLIIFSGGYVFFYACMRGKDMHWLEESEVKGTPYGKYFDHICTADQWIKTNRAQDVYIQSEDGLRLHGMWIPAENAKGTIILAHGYRSTFLVDFGYAFPFYHDLGLNLLVPDQRCHGKSQGKYITFGVKESGDIQKWIEYHNNKFGQIPLLLSGLSMGASTVLYLADADLPANVRGIIADCGFTSPWEIIGSVFRRVTHLPAEASLWVTEWFAKIIAGFSLREKDTRRSLRQSRVPVLLIHGTDDRFVPCEMSKQGYACGIGNKQLLLVDGAGHGVSFLVDRNKYTSAVLTFLNTNIPELE